MKKTIQDIVDWHNKRVLVREDFNVPQDEHGNITNDTRIRETLPTLKYLVERGARVIVVSHLGRPKGKVDAKYSLAPIAERLKKLMAPTPVLYIDKVFSPEVQAAADTLKPGSILLLENVRFEPGEESNDRQFAQNLASLAEIYVNDAFGAAHRAHASTEGVAHFMPVKVAGLLMAKEIAALSSITVKPEKPYTAIIGGSKVSTKITVLEHLLDVVDNLVIGGGMLYTFLKAQGIDVGKSLVEDAHFETARQLLDKAAEKNVLIYLASDTVIADAFQAEANKKVVLVTDIPPDWMGLDIGPDSIEHIKQMIRNSKTVLWNGPLGVFEFPAFANGTRAVAEAIAEWTEAGFCKSILGGGDTVAAIEQLGISPERYTHVSTGGGASLEFLEGRSLPGITVLDNALAPAH